MNNTSLINLKNVTKTYANGYTALNNISLDIAKGSFTFIIGPSGSGKTSLLNIIGLLDTATSGTFAFAGKEISNPVDCFSLRAKEVGFIFQLFYLLDHLTCIENIEIPMYALGIRSKDRIKRAEELLDKVGLLGKKNNKSSELSGGEKQRIARARALANKPGLILADEPTGNLDSMTSKAIIDLLKSINNNHTTIIVVTHNTELAFHGSQTLKIKDGKIVD